MRAKADAAAFDEAVSRLGQVIAAHAAQIQSSSESERRAALVAIATGERAVAALPDLGGDDRLHIVPDPLRIRLERGAGAISCHALVVRPVAALRGRVLDEPAHSARAPEASSTVHSILAPVDARR